jgi:voltage-gated potassium channel
MTERTIEVPESSERTAVPTPFDVFILVLTIFSLINIILILLLPSDDQVDVILIVDGFICIIFLCDFLLRLRRAPSKRGYLVGQHGWLDLVGSIPVPGFRLARVARVIWIGRAAGHSGSRRIVRSALADRAGSSLLIAIFLTIVVLQYGSMAMLGVEGGKDGANIQTASDALWWSYVSITTVGYGDRYPVTNTGRVIGAAVLAVGVGLFGVITGFLANLFLGPRRAQKEQSPDPGTDLRLELIELRRVIEGLGVPQGAALARSTADSSGPDPRDPAPSPGRVVEHERD